MTLRPHGPKVIFTAAASFRTPWRIAARASLSKAIFFAAISVSCLILCYRGNTRRIRLILNNRHNVRFAHDEVLFAVDLDLGARVAGKQHRVALLDLHLAEAS